MLKRIPKSDISIRPFKAYKEWSFSSGSTQIDVLEADDKSTNLSGQFPKNSIYGQLRAQFYNGNEDNPFLRAGNKSNRYVDTLLSAERFLSGSAKVISIPNVYVGEGIKKGSVILKDNLNELNEISYFDDSFGNIQDNRDSIRLGKIDIENELINFSDLSNYIYSASIDNMIGDFDIENNILSVYYNGDSYELTIVSMDIETSVVIVEDIPFLPQESQGIKIGNVFYNQGLIVLTRNSADLLKNDWKLDYKSTQTIYENEYLLIVNEDEFNVSQNPSAVVEVGKMTEFITGSDNKIYKVTTNPGVKYIKKKSILETGEILDYRFGSSVSMSVSGGFEHYDLSGSVDSTGSFLTPFITTIGLYDDNCDLVAVAKLPQPIKSEPDIPVNFIVRFDT
jgi:hypothetical protein